MIKRLEGTSFKAQGILHSAPPPSGISGFYHPDLQIHRIDVVETKEAKCVPVAMAYDRIVWQGRPLARFEWVALDPAVTAHQ